MLKINIAATISCRFYGSLYDFGKLYSNDKHGISDRGHLGVRRLHGEAKMATAIRRQLTTFKFVPR